MSRAKVRLGGLCFACVMVGASIRASVTAVCAGPNVTGVSVVRAVRAGLVYLSVFFGIYVIVVIIIAARAGGTALVTCRFTSGTLGVWGVLSTWRVALFGKLLSMSRWGAAPGSGAGRHSVRRIGLLATG